MTYPLVITLDGLDDSILDALDCLTGGDHEKSLDLFELAVPDRHREGHYILKVNFTANGQATLR